MQISLNPAASPRIERDLRYQRQCHASPVCDHTRYSPLRLAAVLVAAAVAGCASTPRQPVETNRTLAEVMHQRDDFRLQEQFVQEGTAYAVGHLNMTAENEPDTLNFIDGRLACSTHSGIPGFDWQWVSQPDGLAYLASMLRLECGSDDEMAPRELAEATVPIPVGKQEPPEPQQSGPSGFGKSLVDILGGMVVYPVVALGTIALAPFWVPDLVASEPRGRDLQSKRAGIELGMSREIVEKNLGPPTTEIALPGSDTQVLAYGLSDWAKLYAGNWYAGVRYGQVIWMHIPLIGEKDWLDGLARQAIENAGP